MCMSMHGIDNYCKQSIKGDNQSIVSASKGKVIHVLQGDGKWNQKKEQMTSFE